MHEWPLVIFTLLMQASIGCLAVTLLCHLRMSSSDSSESMATAVRKPLVCAFIFGALGLLASLAHLGNPLHMFYTLVHISSSWMSREVLFTALYMALMFVGVAVLLLKKRFSFGLFALSLLVGLIDLFVMSAIYANTLFNLWSGWFTYASFYGSAFLMGGVLACALLMPTLRANNQNDAADRVLRISFAACGLGILLLLVSASSLLTQIGQPVSMGISSRELPEGLFSLNLLRIALLAVGLFIAGRLLCKGSEKSSAGAILSVSALCVVAGEVVGRYVFFCLGA